MREYSTDPIWVRLDVHQSRVTVAVLRGDSAKAHVVNLPGEVSVVRKFLRRLSEEGRPWSCYAASGAGFVVKRTLGRDGFHCEETGAEVQCSGSSCEDSAQTPQAVLGPEPTETHEQGRDSCGL